MKAPTAPVSAMNTNEARNRNLAAVFEAIREAGGVSRTEIGAHMPFSLQTVTSIGQELIAMGLIREGDRLQVNAKGKPQTTLHIVPERGYAIGMQMRWNSITLCLVDLDYTVIDQLNIAIGAFEPREYVGEVISHLRAFIDRHAERDIWALSVSGPLPVASPGMHASLPRRFAWMDAEWFQSFWEAYSAQSLCDELEAALGLPAYILNNPQSAAIAEALAAPLEARMVYIMVGLSLGATVVNHRQLNLELWRYAGEIGYVMYKDEPLNRIFSVSGLREQLDLDEPQGVYEEIIERVLAETPDVLDDWFDSSAERLRLIVNFLENTVRPDGIAVGGFMPVGYLRELVSRVEPLPDSVVLETDDPQRIMPRLAVARHSAESIPFGAGAMALSSRANSRFSDLIGQRRLPG